ncbi:MAG: hypothetical protein LBE79_03760 [Tannerella sp.]|nr:hypothetical protein [Tannerella sp.]
MDNKFSLNRMGLMLRADWIEYQKSFIIFATMLLGVNAIMLRATSEQAQVAIFSISFLTTLLFFYSFVGKKVHREKNRFLTLPASGIEKFGEMLLVCLILFCVYLLIHAMLLGISGLVNGAEIWVFQQKEIASSASSYNFNSVGIAIGMSTFVCIFLFICSIAFRKFPLQIGILCLILYGMICTYTVYHFVKMDNFEQLNSIKGFMHSNAMVETVFFLHTYSFWGLGFASAILLYVSYLKLKEKQIR